MTQADIQEQSTDAITDLEDQLITEVVYDQPVEAVAQRTASLTDAQRQVCRYLLTVYFDRLPDGTLKITGGRDAVDLDNVRDRLDVTNRMRRLLGLPAISEQMLLDWAAVVTTQRGSARTSTSAESIVVW